MRLLKMRAWDKEYDCFITDFYIHADGETIWLGDSETGNPERFIIEQFTGLRDKNGKEIYEGDIVKLPGYKSGGKVIYDFGFWSVDVVDDLYTLNQYIHWGCLVIGNIHENPEMIE